MFMRILAVCATVKDSALLREAATFASIPIEFAVTAADERRVAEPRSTRASSTSCWSIVRSPKRIAISSPPCGRNRSQPQVVVVAPTQQEAVELATSAADAVVVRPGTLDEAKSTLEGCLKLKIPSRVLVVDDSPTVRRIVRKILANASLPVEIAEAGRDLDALERLGAEKFDVVMLDDRMPGRNGLELLLDIKRAHPQLRVVMMSADEGDALETRARAAGAAGFLRKPFYPADIDALFYRFQGLRRSA